jgi:hypothetical protein
MTELGRGHITEHMSPIATYREWRLDRKCDFELYPDSIRAAGRNARGKFEITITLSTLDPNCDRMWIYNSLFYASAILFMVGIVTLWTVVIGFNDGTFNSLSHLIGTLTLGGFTLAITNSRKVELVRFNSVAGVPRLDIARTRNGSEEFDPFVSAVVERIVSSKASSRNGS